MSLREIERLARMYADSGGLVPLPRDVDDGPQEIDAADAMRLAKRSAKRLESAAYQPIIDYLASRGVFAWRNNSGILRDRTGRGVRFGLVGSSDILGCLPDGRFLAIEVKRTAKDKPTDDQRRFLDRIDRLGGVAIVATGVDDVAAALRI